MIDTIITGSSGFIGGRLLGKLVDNRIQRLRHEYIDDSYRPKADRFFFLSTYGNMAHHKNTSRMVKSNVHDLLRVLAFSDVGWFCYMSSSSVTLPIQTPYSRTKRAAEEILQALPELKSCIVRPYSVTGRNEQREHLIPTLIRSCMEGEEMPFDPYPVHDFIDVEDVVDALIQLSEYQHTGIFELGNGIGYTNQAVLELVEEATGNRANITKKVGLRKYDNLNWVCKETYRTKPSKSLAQSISEMVEAYKREKS